MPKPGPRTTYRYSPDFKATAVRLSQLPGVSVSDVARSLYIHPFMLSRWRRLAREGLIVTKGVDVDPASKLFRLTQLILLLAAFLSGAATIFLGFFYFSLYWPYRDLFNGEGRYFDEQNVAVYHEQNGLLLVPTLAFLLLSLLFCIAFLVRRRAASRAARDPRAFIRAP